MQVAINPTASEDSEEERMGIFYSTLKPTCYISIIYLNLIKIVHYMIKDLQQSPARSSNIVNTNNTTKSEIQIRRDKKKKLTAFKTFLDNASDSNYPEEQPSRIKFTASFAFEQKAQPFNSCKVCREYLTSQSKVCQFCKDTVCTTHFRKRRRHTQTNKFTRICDHCEDKYLMQKYCQNEIKTEESIISQEIVFEKKHDKLQQMLANKKVQLEMAQNKEVELATTYNHEIARLKAKESQLDTKINKAQNGLRENTDLQLYLVDLQTRLPPSLKYDFQYLQGQNYRIARDLQKYDKLCNDIIAARNKKQKEMYREYYQWQEEKRIQLEVSETESAECNII